MVPTLPAVLALTLSFLSSIRQNYLAAGILFLIAAYFLFVLASPSLQRKKSDPALFYAVPILPNLWYLEQSFSAYKGRRPRKEKAVWEKKFLSLSCDERKGLVKDEVNRLGNSLKPGRLYLTETHEKFIELMGDALAKDGKAFEEIAKIPAIWKGKTHGAFKKIYMDQYKNCWECPSYPNGRGCSVTSKKFLDNNFLEKRKTFICIFRVVEFPKD